MVYLLQNASYHRLPLNSMPFHVKCKILILFFHLSHPNLWWYSSHTFYLLHRLYTSKNIITAFALNIFLKKLKMGGGCLIFTYIFTVSGILHPFVEVQVSICYHFLPLEELPLPLPILQVCCTNSFHFSLYEKVFNLLWRVFLLDTEV